MRWLISFFRRRKSHPNPARRVVITAWGTTHEVSRHIDPVRLLANAIRKAP